LHKPLRGPLPDRPVNITRLTEPASPGTAAEQFEHDPVVDYVYIRYDHLFREVYAVEISYDPFPYLRRIFILYGSDCLQSTVVVVLRPVKAGHIYAFDAGYPVKEILP